jgi:hypothetical protein
VRLPAWISFWASMWTVYFSFGIIWFGLEAIGHPVTRREGHAFVVVCVILFIFSFKPGRGR